MKNFINNVHVEGYIFNHTLQYREGSKNNPNIPFIMGTINIATDEQAINVVPVRFSYVTEKYSKSGKENATFKVLKQIIEDDNTYEINGTGATKVRIDGNIDVNDFLGRDGNMVESKLVSGSFCHILNGPISQKEASTFEADMLIAAAGIQEVENGDDYMNLRGYVFNFRGDLIPVTFSIHNKDGIKYFDNCDISNANPLLTKVWGNIVSTTVVSETKVESAFGSPKIIPSSRSFRAWEVAGCSSEPYEFNDESTITIDEFKDALKRREQAKAEAKARAEERQNNTPQSSFPSNETSSNSVSNVGFDFKF